MDSLKIQSHLPTYVPSPAKRTQLTSSFLKPHAERINQELRDAGAVKYDLMLPETRYLPFVIHTDEHIGGSVYGRYENGRGALIATDKRVLFLDKKPMFSRCDEIDYGVVGGVTRTGIGPKGFVTLHTRLGDYKIRTFNTQNAINFVNYIETKCLRGDFKRAY